MARKENLKKVLSLSAASMALLQTATLTQSQITQSGLPASTTLPSADVSKKNAQLTLQPPPGRMALMYAGHTSHSSHASHYSGTTGDNYYSAPAQTAPTYTPPPAPASPPPRPPTPATNAVSSLLTTNDLTATNVMTGVYPSEEIERLTKSAAAGSPVAQFALGLAYANGTEGVKQNIERAKMLFELSAIQGNTDAKAMLDSLNETNTQSITNSISNQ